MAWPPLRPPPLPLITPTSFSLALSPSCSAACESRSSSRRLCSDAPLSLASSASRLKGRAECEGAMRSKQRGFGAEGGGGCGGLQGAGGGGGMKSAKGMQGGSVKVRCGCPHLWCRTASSATASRCVTATSCSSAHWRACRSMSSTPCNFTPRQSSEHRKQWHLIAKLVPGPPPPLPLHCRSILPPTPHPLHTLTPTPRSPHLSP